MNLHLGCGGIYLEGYVNIDLKAFEGKVDREYDLSKPLDYKDNSVDLIEAYHLFEHLPYGSIEEVVASWYRVLKPQGKLILEMPDFDEVLFNLLNDPNSEARLKSVFGNQDREGQFHHWGWNKKRIQDLLVEIGFKNIHFLPATDYHKDLDPSFRCEATK